MNPFNAILVATDFSAAANNAVRRAALLAREHDARLSILHVIDRRGVDRAGNGFSPAIDPAFSVAQARVDLRRLADELSRTFDVTADLVVKIGDPLDVLVSESSRASLVVLGRRAGASIKDLVFGTPAGRLLDACARPVLVVKQAAEGPYRRVLAGLDFTLTSDAAALLAAELAPAADLHFTHAFHSRQDDALRRTDVPAAILRKLSAREEAGVVAQMQRRVATIGFDSRELRFAVGRGPSASTILNQEQTQGADVVAVGRQRRSKWLDAFLGSVSRRVLARSRGDVLVVPSLPGSSAGSRAAAARRLAGGRVEGATFARREWTIEADPTHTRPPAWSTGDGVWRANPLGAAPE
jgi:nucleotide-binding universal stress UspA family protein